MCLSCHEHPCPRLNRAGPAIAISDPNVIAADTIAIRNLFFLFIAGSY